MPDVTFDRFKTIVADQLGVEPDQVVTEASFVEDLNADSLDLVELIMAFEEEYQMEIQLPTRQILTRRRQPPRSMRSSTR